MISKGYVTDMPYTPEAGRWLETWVWQSDKTPVPVRFENADGADVVIGHITPVRWWKQTTKKDGGENVDSAMIYFNVKHVISPEKRMGDFCGANHRVKFGVVRGSVVSAEVVKQ